MAKTCMVERNKKRRRMVKKYAAKRAALKEIIYSRDLPMEERFRASMKLAKLPRNSSKVRIRNRCALSGRPRGYFRKFDLSRLALRDLSGKGSLPGVTKSSW